MEAGRNLYGQVAGEQRSPQERRQGAKGQADRDPGGAQQADLGEIDAEDETARRAQTL